MSTLKLITFDVTGTILKFRVPVGRQYANIGSKYGVHIQPDKLTSNFKHVFTKMLTDYPNFGLNDIGWENWWQKLVELTFFKSLPEGSSIEKSILHKISTDLIEIYKTKECWELAEGAQCLLDALRSKQITLGVISNYDPRLENILKDLDVYKYFKFVLTSYCAKYEKPNPEIFKIVENINKDLKKKEILHVGDSPKLDFDGARNVGWNAILVGDKYTNYPDIDKEWTVNSLGDIMKKLELKQML